MGSLSILSKYNRYIIYTTLSALLNKCLYGLNYNTAFITVSVSGDDFSKNFTIHRLICYFTTMIFALIFYRIEILSSQRETSTDLIQKNKKKEIDLVFFKVVIPRRRYTDVEQEKQKTKSFKLLCFYSLIFLWIIEEQLLESFYLIFQDLDFWMIELFIISYLNTKVFKVQIYNHQMFAFFFSLFASLLKVGTIILSFYDPDSPYTGYLPIYYIRIYPFLKITFGISLYLLLILLRSIVNISLKWYMDIKYISPNKILMLYGIFGTIVYLIVIPIVTTFNCENNSINDDGDYNISTYLCKVNYTNNTYIDSYLDYFDNWNNFNNRIREIVVIIFGIFAFFYNKLYTILIIKFLSPVHVIFSIPINFILEKIVMIIYTLIVRNISEYKEGEYYFIFATKNKYKFAKFSLDISGDILSLIGFLIYLEIIRLSCKQFRYNIRSNIIKRGAVELMVNQDISEDSDDSKISENNSSIENGYDQNKNLDDS